MADPAFRASVALITSGVPAELVFQMDDIDRLAWAVAVGQQKGRTWDWNRRAWDEDS